MKTKKIIISVSIILIVLIGVGLSVGLTYSLWSDTSGGESSVAPSVDSNDYNVYTKYLVYRAHLSNGSDVENVKYGDTIELSNGVTVSYFTCTGLTQGTLLSDIIFPAKIAYNNSTSELKYISNTIFTDVTYKALPTRIVIPSTVEQISQGAFSGLSALQTLVIYKHSEGGSSIRIGYGAFANCSLLKTILIDNGLSVKCTDMVFAGCSSLTTINRAASKLPNPPAAASINYIESMSSTSYVELTTANWTTYKAIIFPGTPSGFDPYPAPQNG